MLYTLRTTCPVKWTAAQEKSISQEYPWSDLSNETASEYVRRTYLQFLWLPESMMPLDKLKPALLRVSHLFAHEFASTSSAHATLPHPLHDLLRPHLLTTRACTQKWESTIPDMLLTEESNGSKEHEIMWFALRHEKMSEEEEEEEEQWQAGWLQHMERREAMIQILLYFLLLTLPRPPPKAPTKKPRSHSITAPSPSPRKSRLQNHSAEPIPLEDRLEAFLDRLSMWQLMGSIDGTAGGDVSLRNPVADSSKSDGRATDERDWMQTFCEDIIEPVFKQSLPDQCELFREKVFPGSPFSDDTDTDTAPPSATATPPDSPRLAANRQRSSSIISSHSQSTTRMRTRAPSSQTLSRTSSSSLSATLHEERVRERSKSLSVGPGGTGKRPAALTREVSMSTNFKAKTKPAAPKDKRAKAEPTKRSAVKKELGVTLVKATPAERQEKHGRARENGNGKEGRLPSMLASSQMEARFPVEGGSDDHEWTVEGSPDILLLEGYDVGMWQATPTKRPKVKAKGKV